ERLYETGEHRAVHALFLTSAHLVPVIARQFQLRKRRQLHLRHGHEVVEASLASRLLLRKPADLITRSFFGEPAKQRVALSGPIFFERLEPFDEALDISRSLGGFVDDLLSK